MTVQRKNGFTLVEILIVVVILGILAAIVIPQFTNASETAKASSLISQLQTIRSQLELFQVQHNGQYPTLVELQGGADDWAVMTSETDVTKAIVVGGDFGPYLQQAPSNPFTINTLVVAAGTPVAASGWTYAEGSGEVKAVLPAGLVPADLGLGLNDYEQVAGG